MARITNSRRIWAWMFFDWAQQPFATLGLTFIFAPYFSDVAKEVYTSSGIAEDAARVQVQSVWSSAQIWAGLCIAIPAPILGAWADSSGRKLPWIWVFVSIAILCASLLWGLTPDGQSLTTILLIFWIGFIASESSFNLNNAILPTLTTPDKIGRLSGSASAFGYWGGVLALFIMLLFFAEGDTGKTLIGLDPAFGLDAEEREGTRAVGPFIALWFTIFLVPYALWMRDDPSQRRRPKFSKVMSDLWQSVKRVSKRKSYRSFLIGSMFYRDALTALYSYGGIYAALVLDWHIIQIGVFGIIAAIAAAALSWVGGLADQRFGPKPVITFCCVSLILVCSIIVGMSREQLFGIPFPEGSALPDLIFYACGCIMGGAGGALYSASRTMLLRHADPQRTTEAFGLFSLAGRSTAFLAPFLIYHFTEQLQSNQLGFLPVILLFIIGLILLRWVNSEGEKHA